MNAIKKFIAASIYPIILTGLSAFIAIRNYVPGTWLSGWDTLHPEVNFPLNFQRLIQGVWRYDQGLGSVAGHSHMADLPRVFFLSFISNFAQLDFLRYSYIFLMFIIGPLGIYFLLSHIFKNRTRDHDNKPTFAYRHISFIGACVYIFNLGTIQQFHVPFEMFPTQWAFLPWIILLVLKILENGKFRYILLFGAVNFIATPQAYAAQLWYAFFGILVLFLASYVFFHARKRIHIKRSIVIVAMLLAANSFWLLPNLYYVGGESSAPRHAKQNRLSSEEFQLRNRQFGNIEDVALIKGFYMDWSVYDHETEKLTNLMPTWQSHFSKISIQILGYSIFAMVLFGLFMSVRKKDHLFTSFFPFFIVPFILLANQEFPFNFFFDTITQIPLFNEALRFVFTKFSILLLFSYVLYFSYALLYILHRMSKIRRGLLFGWIFFALTWYVSPVFAGQLLSPIVQTQVPEKYQNMWNFMETQPDGRVLTLPLHSIAGWQYYDWGYQGSGFNWFGLPQQVLDRDSDRWNQYNEEAYREHSYAMYSRNPEAFLNTLRKYNVSYIMWDRSVTTTEEKNKDQILFVRETEEILLNLQQDGHITKLESFDDIEIYQIGDKKHGFVAKGTPPNVLPSYIWNFEDVAYNKFGTYVSDPNKSEDVFYLFRTFLNINDRLDPSVISIDDTSETFNIQLDKPSLEDSFISLPDIKEVEKDIAVEVMLVKKETSYEVELLPILPKDIQIKGSVPVNIQQANTSLTLNGETYEFDLSVLSEDAPARLGEGMWYFDSQNFVNANPVDIAISYPSAGEITQFESRIPRTFTSIKAEEIFNRTTSEGEFFLAEEADEQFTRFIAEKDINGFFVPFESLTHAKGYIVQLTSRNVEGTPLRVCLFNDYTNRCSLLDELSSHANFGKDTFVVPATDEGQGYSLRIDNLNFGGFTSINDLKDISIIPLPYNFLSRIHVQKSAYEPYLEQYADIERVNNYIFRTSAEYFTNNKNSSVVLYQSFNEGWHAYAVDSTNDSRTYLPFLFGNELKSHVLVNNWANGWMLDIDDVPPGSRQKEIVMIFLPQYLEYTGFLLFAWVFFSVLLLGTLRKLAGKSKIDRII